MRLTPYMMPRPPRPALQAGANDLTRVWPPVRLVDVLADFLKQQYVCPERSDPVGSLLQLVQRIRFLIGVQIQRDGAQGTLRKWIAKTHGKRGIVAPEAVRFAHRVGRVCFPATFNDVLVEMRP